MNLYDQIKNSLDIVDVIGEKVRLKKSGRGFVGLCPFHDEKTGSFHVFTDTQSYYCFGCHEAGDIFTFVMKTEGLNFQEALRLLASRAGIKIEGYEKKNRGERSLYEILEIAEKFFMDNLTGPQGAVGRAYMQKRNMTANDITRFSLGYSLNSWDSLTKFLRQSGIKDKQILDAGLALPGSRGIYDRFRGRLIFPVKDITGKIIAFGGRLIDGEGAKYINSPENEIYSKRKNLYLLNSAKNFIKEKGRSILVEGYMDALRLHKCGFGEAVASLGTSLTAEQAELLSRFSSRCYICYDSDTAGQNAALRGMYILAEHGLDVRVINIPEGKDPDEFLSANAPEEFEKIISEARPLVLQQIEILAPALKNPATRKNATSELFENLSKLKSDEVAPYRSQISELTFISPYELEDRIFGKKIISEVNDNVINNSQIFSRDDELFEAGLCALLFNHSECRLKLAPEEAYKILQSGIAKETAVSILTENPDNLFMLWLSTGDTEKTGFIKRGEEYCRMFREKNFQDIWEKIYNRIKYKWAQRRINEINFRMRQNLALPSELLEVRELTKVIEKLGVRN
ncbi:MAG: DNA primase [Synergistales bacterium]|nr:DNA primase [Synergistales bacterium]MDY6401990.1 DNA primase [Synergistales bacterium]MDY6405161.1 DNA primase [Synergistales bacterium]MDY6409704.1 DNA primase [Synergistales bacterium]MDY6414064.1 DNA primase [Synergistales bacterium]